MANLVDTSVNGDLRVTGTMFGTQAGNYATCATAGATAAKTATISGFTLTTGIHVFVKFTVTNTAAVASLTLNVSGTGAKSMKYRGGNLPAVGTLSASRVYEFIYDGTNWELVGDLDTNTQTVTGVKGNAESSYRTGQVNLTAANIGASASDHTHGNIGNGGTLTDTAAAAAGNDYVVIRDADNNKVQTSTIKGTDVADAVSKKHSHSTLTLSTTAQAYDGSHTLALPSSDPYTSARTPTSHTHGNIANGGTLTDTAAAAAGNDYVVIRDADNSKIQTSTIKGTDVADAVSKKHSHSTLTLSTTAQAYDGSHTLALPSTDPYTSARTPTSHTHGNITNGGALQTNDITIANGDKLVVTDSSDSSKVARTSVSFDGSTTTTALTPKGTFEAFAKSGDITTAINNLDSNKTSTDGTNVQVKVTEADGKISAVNITTDTTANRNEGVYYVAGTTDYPAWVANHAYAVNDNAISGGKAYYCKTAHTSGSSFDSSKWTAIVTPVIKGTITGVTALYTGIKIALKWPITGGSSSTYLNINNLGNVYIRRNDGNTTTHLPANTVCFLTYDGTYWRWADYDSNSTYSGFVCGYCSTAAGTAAKEVSATNYSASTGNTILVRFTNTNSAAGALTLKAGGVTKTIKWNGTVTASGTTSAIPAGTWPCYYDGANWCIWTDGTAEGNYRGALTGNASTATHLVNHGYVRLWASGQYDSTKPYALLAEKTVGTTGNWGYGQLFKMEVQNRYVIFKIDLHGSSSSITSGTNTARIIYGHEFTQTEVNKAVVVTYAYTANANCIVRIYSNLSLTASHWQRVSLRQLDNQAGDQCAYNGWDAFTYYQKGDNTAMVASVTGTVMTNVFNTGTFYGNATSATKATQDSDGNAINSTYLMLSGGTMTGKINAWASQYTDDGTTGAIDMKNSNIVGLNSLYTADASDGASEGIHFFRESGKYDTLWMNSGHIYFVPNRDVGTSTSAADSKKVAILPASITSGHVVVTDGTSGDVKGVAASSLSVGSATSATNVALTGTVKTTSTTNGDTIQFQAGSGTAGTVTIVNAKHAASADSATKATGDADGNSIKGNYLKTTSGTKSLSFGSSTTIGTVNGTNVQLSLPANPNTDTKQRIVASDSKTYLTGVTTAPTSSNQDLTGVANTNVYATAGQLHATTFDVNSKCTLQFNTTTNALDFVFA